MANTIAENLERLQIAREDIINAIQAKGGTISDNAGFEDFSAAIASIPSGGGGGLEVIQSAEWDNMPRAQKKSYGLVGIQTADSGYHRGDIVYGEDYSDYEFRTIKTGWAKNSATWTFTTGGEYKLIVIAMNSEASTYQLSTSASLNGTTLTGTTLSYNTYEGAADNKRNYRVSSFDINADTGDALVISLTDINDYSSFMYIVIDTLVNTISKVLTSADRHADGSYANEAIAMYGTFSGGEWGTVNINYTPANTYVDTGNPGANYKSAYIFWFTISSS